MRWLNRRPPSGRRSPGKPVSMMPSGRRGWRPAPGSSPCRVPGRSGWRRSSRRTVCRTSVTWSGCGSPRSGAVPRSRRSSWKPCVTPHGLRERTGWSSGWSTATPERDGSTNDLASSERASGNRCPAIRLLARSGCGEPGDAPVARPRIVAEKVVRHSPRVTGSLAFVGRPTPLEVAMISSVARRVSFIALTAALLLGPWASVATAAPTDTFADSAAVVGNRSPQLPRKGAAPAAMAGQSPAWTPTPVRSASTSCGPAAMRPMPPSPRRRPSASPSRTPPASVAVASWCTTTRKRIVRTIDGREAAPASFTDRTFTDNAGAPLNFTAVVNSGLSVGVPGTPALWDKAARPVRYAEIGGSAPAGRAAG